MNETTIYLFHRINFSVSGNSGVFTFANTDIAYCFIDYILHEPLVSTFKYARFHTSEANYIHRSTIEIKSGFGPKQFSKILDGSKTWKWLE